jgi:SAM-dependent methyltransferase
MGVDADVDALTGQGSAARAAARGERLPFGDDTFDLVCCAWVLEHVEHPRTFATEVHRVLKPGGRIVFVTPNAWNAVTWMIRAIPNPLHPLIMRRLQRRHEHDTYPVRYRMNTWRSIDGILAGAGLVRERLLLNGDPTYMAFGSRSLRVTAATERLLDLPGLKNARVHLIGVYRKPLGPAMDR